MTRTVVFSAVLIALLVSSVGYAAQPACPTAGRTRTVTYHPTLFVTTVTVTLPANSVLCPNYDTGGCCDSITITGLLPGWTVTGAINQYFLFTTKFPPGDPRARQLFNTINVNVTVDATGTVTINNICYPAAHDWPSAEVHVDISLLVSASGVPVAGIGSDPSIPGVIGPGVGGWDPVCDGLGCTPGFWKTHPGAWLGVKPTDQFSVVFGVPGKPTWNPSLTMIQATATGGGDGRNADFGMVRACSSAYVGAQWAAHQPNLTTGTCPFFLLGTATPSAIVLLVQQAYAGTISFATAHQACDQFNQNALCGPNGPWLNTTTGGFGGPACIPPAN